ALLSSVRRAEPRHPPSSLHDALPIWPGASLAVVSPTVRDGLFINSADASAVRRAVGRLYGRPDAAGSAVRLVHQAASVAWADRGALCGASVLRSRSVRRGLHAKVASGGWRRFEAVGVSVGPLTSPDQAAEVRRFAASFDRVVGRGSASLDHVADWPDADKYRLGGDMAALWPGM